MKIIVTTECVAQPEVAFAAHLDIPNWPRFIDSIERVMEADAWARQRAAKFAETDTVSHRG